MFEGFPGTRHDQDFDTEYWNEATFVLSGLQSQEEQRQHGMIDIEYSMPLVDNVVEVTSNSFSYVDLNIMMDKIQALD